MLVKHTIPRLHTMFVSFLPIGKTPTSPHHGFCNATFIYQSKILYARMQIRQLKEAKHVFNILILWGIASSPSLRNGAQK